MELIQLTADNLERERNAPVQAVHIQTREAARSAPSPFTTFSLFYDGQFVTHEILSEKKFDKLLTDKGWQNHRMKIVRKTAEKQRNPV